MTIASEISRLQCAKADICTAIENKGVTVGDITLDEYSCCIDAISSGGGGPYYIDYLAVGGGGGGEYYYYNNNYCSAGGGGGGGNVVEGCCEQIPVSVPVIIGKGGCGGMCFGENGGDTTIGNIVFAGGGGAARECTGCYSGGISGGGFDGGYSGNPTAQGGGGGGATGCGSCSSVYTTASNGGAGKCGYGGGGGGGGICTYGVGCDGGGNGACRYNTSTCRPCMYATNATNCGGGGGGGYPGGNGAGGIVKISYPADGSYGFEKAEGGVITCEGGTITHTFTESGEFRIAHEDGLCYVNYMVVGGGGAQRKGSYTASGGAGGEVILGKISVEGCLGITIGCGGTCCSYYESGGDSKLDYGGGCIIATGGKFGGFNKNYMLGSCGASKYMPGGAGARGNGGDAEWSYYRGGAGGQGYGCYGWGGDGGGCNSRSHTGTGGVGGSYYASYDGCDATCYGSGGGGSYCSGCPGKGCQGVVDICYPTDGSYGFTTATGGDCCYTCDGMCVHRFTSDGTFTIVS